MTHALQMDELNGELPSSAAQNGNSTNHRQIRAGAIVPGAASCLLGVPSNDLATTPNEGNTPPSDHGSPLNIQLLPNQHHNIPRTTSAQSINQDNPWELFGSNDEIDAFVHSFAKAHGLMADEDVLKRAAQVLRHGLNDALKTVTFLPSEPAELRREGNEGEERLWLIAEQSLGIKPLREAIFLVCTLAAICQGWSQSVLGGTGIPLQQMFDLSNPWKFSVLSACVPLSAGILSPLIADPLQNHTLGRRGATAVSAAITIGATIGAASTRSIPAIIGCRIIIGASLGAKASIVAPFIAELSPVPIRGALLSSW